MRYSIASAALAEPPEIGSQLVFSIAGLVEILLEQRFHSLLRGEHWNLPASFVIDLNRAVCGRGASCERLSSDYRFMTLRQPA